MMLSGRFKKLNNYFKDFKQQKRKIFFLKWAAIFSALILVGLLVLQSSQQTKKILKEQIALTPKAEGISDVGILTESVRQEAYVARLEKDYYTLNEKVENLENNISSIQNILKDFRTNQSDISKALLNLDENFIRKVDERFNILLKQPAQGEGSLNAVNQNTRSSLELDLADVSSVKKGENQNSVYLPIGSFCKGTLLTGVYAPSNESNPLPVLIVLEEAFYGPNKTRIPLKGAFVLGKAFGDVVSERALIQIISISAVLPDGKTFEQEGNIGYIADEFGQFGIKGQVIRNTGKELGLSFLTGFMSGAAQAVADAQTTTIVGDAGQTARNVTGDVGQSAAFSGMAQSAAHLSSYYQDQIDNLIPAIYVQTGTKVYFIVQKGVQVDGLKNYSYSPLGFIDE